MDKRKNKRNWKKIISYITVSSTAILAIATLMNPFINLIIEERNIKKNRMLKQEHEKITRLENQAKEFKQAMMDLNNTNAQYFEKCMRKDKNKETKNSIQALNEKRLKDTIDLKTTAGGISFKYIFGEELYSNYRCLVMWNWELYQLQKQNNCPDLSLLKVNYCQEQAQIQKNFCKPDINNYREGNLFVRWINCINSSVDRFILSVGGSLVINNAYDNKKAFLTENV